MTGKCYPMLAHGAQSQAIGSAAPQAVRFIWQLFSLVPPSHFLEFWAADGFHSVKIALQGHLWRLWSDEAC